MKRKPLAFGDLQNKPEPSGINVQKYSFGAEMSGFRLMNSGQESGRTPDGFFGKGIGSGNRH